ncbi:hypothetical protein [Acinetobacter terrae]|jgi:hypothetical protein|uniref:hypothetical protein n=1 Tax=Acinetobacter terrae TaxID=2731247 RepID=UPI0007D870D3|nr:hypothetical protein [Acinetobacter terrae]NNH16338.1 hypothetical protein [Acinetobacter terrae]OAL86326.1 hypothetical protein AY608_13265 [Acinetobacter terrae]
MTNNSSPEKSPWGWKALIIACILGAFFMGFFYLAISNEPDYMPSQKQKQAQQAATSAASEPTAAEMNMTEAEHAAMTETEKSAEHGAGH